MKLKDTKYLKNYGNITGYGSKYWDKGLDVDLKIGDPVYAPKDGVVVDAGNKGAWGNQVIIKDKYNNRILLSHLDAIDVAPGQKIKAGQPVGKGGNTGRTYSTSGGDGSHLDITIQNKGGEYISPQLVEKYVNTEPEEKTSLYSKLISNKNLDKAIDQARLKGYTDTQILETFAKKDKDFAKRYEATKRKYGKNDKVKDDRDLLNFFSMKATKRMPTVPSVPIKEMPQDVEKKEEKPLTGIYKEREDITTPEEVIEATKIKGSPAQGVLGVFKNIFSKDSIEDIKTGVSTQLDDWERRAKELTKIPQKAVDKEYNFLDVLVKVGGEVFGTIGDVIGNTLITGAKLLTNEEQEQKVKEKVGETMQKALNSDLGKYAVENWQELKEKKPKTAMYIESGVSIANGLLDIGAIKLIPKGFPKKPKIKPKIEFPGNKQLLMGEIIPKTTKADDIIKKAVDITLEKNELPSLGQSEELLKYFEKEAPKLTSKEIKAGIDPALKKYIQRPGFSDKLGTYFNIQRANNLDMEAPKLESFVNQRVVGTANELTKSLNDTGTRIGKVREKVKTTRLPFDKIDDVVKIVDDEFNKLNLEVVDGKIRQIPGKQKRNLGNLNIFQDFRDNLSILKSKANIDESLDAIDVMNENINFAKRTQDVSSVIDPIARKVRAKLAEINRKAIGKTYAKDLELYSELKKVEKDLYKAINSKSGTEYLMRVALSGRGRPQLELISQIEKLTGVNLLDDAVAYKITNDVLGNRNNKTLFNQQIENSLANTQGFLSFAGDLSQRNTIGQAKFLFEEAKKIKDAKFDVAEQFLKTARGEKSWWENLLEKTKGKGGLSIQAVDDVKKPALPSSKGILSEIKKAKASGKSFDEFFGDNISAKKENVKKIDIDDLSDDEYITVYHNTNTPLKDFGKTKIFSKENKNEFFVSNTPDEQISGYGKNTLKIRVRKKDLEINDEFQSGEQHYTIKTWKVDEYLFKTKSQLKELWDSID